MDDFQVLLIFFILISNLVQIIMLRNDKKINVEILISIIFLIIFACSIILIREFAFGKIFVYVVIMFYFLAEFY